MTTGTEQIFQAVWRKLAEDLSHTPNRDWVESLIHKAVVAALGETEAANERVLGLVSDQAEDEGLWFNAQTAPEAYLQQELRRLHAAIEAES